MKHFPLSVALVAMLLLSMGATAPSGYIVGDKATNFSLKNIDGTMVSLTDYKNVKGFIVVFTCNHCPYAQIYEQRIIDLHKKYEPKGFPVVAINPNSPIIVPDDSYEEMQKRAAEKKYPFKYLYDEEQTIFPQYGATRTPHVFVLDSNLIVRYIGAIDDNPESERSIKNYWVRNAIDSMLRGEKPKTDFTRAIGCPVKKAPVKKVSAEKEK
jgi:peroxiredoxin